MSNGLAMALDISAGILLGGMFFGGLWWTVRRGLSSTVPAVWFLGSLSVRTAGALGGFYVVSQGDWRRLLACLLGFLVARVVVMRRSRTLGLPLPLPPALGKASP